MDSNLGEPKLKP